MNEVAGTSGPQGVRGQKLRLHPSPSRTGLDLSPDGGLPAAPHITCAATGDGATRGARLSPRPPPLPRLCLQSGALSPPPLFPQLSPRSCSSLTLPVFMFNVLKIQTIFLVALTMCACTKGQFCLRSF